MTDDAAAYDFAKKRSETRKTNVIASIDLLREAVAMGELNNDKAVALATGIEEKGRFLRRIHSDKIRDPNYFSR